MLAVDQIRCVAVMKGESPNGSELAIGRRKQRVQRGSARSVNVVFDRIDLYEAWKAAQHATRGVGHDRWRSKCVIK